MHDQYQCECVVKNFLWEHKLWTFYVLSRQGSNFGEHSHATSAHFVQPWGYSKFPGVTGLLEISQRYQGMSTYAASGIWNTQLSHTKMLPSLSKFPWYCIHTKPSILPDVLLNYWGRQCYHPLDATFVVPSEGSHSQRSYYHVLLNMNVSWNYYVIN